MTKEERLAKRKATMKQIEKRAAERIAKRKNKPSANEIRDKRNADFSTKVKEVNSNKKAEQKLKDEKRIKARKKVVNRITTDKNKRIAAEKDRRAANRKKRQEGRDRFSPKNKKADRGTGLLTDKTIRNRDKKSTRATDKGGRTRASGSEGFKPQSLADQKTGPNMGQVNLKNPEPGNKSNADSPFNKPKAKKSMVDRAKKAVGIGRPPTEKEKMGRNQMNAARKSMGMNMGGKVKKMNMGGAPMNARGKTMADMEGRAMSTGRFRDMPGKMADARGRAMKTGGMLARTGGSSAKMKAKGTRMKAGGAVKKCRMDGIALRGKTRAKERSK